MGISLYDNKKKIIVSLIVRAWKIGMLSLYTYFVFATNGSVTKSNDTPYIAIDTNVFKEIVSHLLMKLKKY